MSTPLDTGNGQATDTDAEFTTADFALLASTGNWDAKPQPAPAAAPAPANTATTPVDRSQPVEDTEGWNTVKPKRGKKSDAKAKKGEAKHQDGDQEPADKKSVILTAANWTPGDYVAVKPADLSELFTAHRMRCQAMDAAGGRILYHGYAGPALTIGIALNVLSWTTAKLSVLLVDPKNLSKAPGSLAETVTMHTRRAKDMNFVAGKVLYSGYAAATTPVTVALNSISWLTAQSAVVVNDPRRIGRVLLGLLFVAIVLFGVAMVVGG